tara:strand:- start:628 stop:825 length:198 start_codon:yes stop_codon:yes gene_type:complete
MQPLERIIEVEKHGDGCPFNMNGEYRYCNGLSHDDPHNADECDSWEDWPTWCPLLERGTLVRLKR